MQDPIGHIPACFFSSGGEKVNDHDHDHDHHHSHNKTAVTRSGQSVVMSVYRTKMADRCRLITVTWCKNTLLHGLSVSIEGPEGDSQYTCKVELKPWYFWRKHGSKKLNVAEKEVGIFWDLKSARFQGETEPSSEYFIAIVCDEEVVLLLGDLKKEAYKKTGCRPALIDPTLVSRKEHVFGKRKFSTKARFHEKGKLHEISIECKNSGNNVINSSSSSSSSSSCSSVNGVDPEMEIKLDGHVLIHVKHLQWKFRGNESIHVNKLRVEVFWDVHDWLFSPGLRHALFIFKPVLSSSGSVSSLSSSSCSSPPLSSSLASTPLSSQTGSSGSLESLNAGGSSEFCLFLYAWKVE